MSENTKQISSDFQNPTGDDWNLDRLLEAARRAASVADSLKQEYRLKCFEVILAHLLGESAHNLDFIQKQKSSSLSNKVGTTIPSGADNNEKAKGGAESFTFNIPEDLFPKILELSHEADQIRVVWFHSTKPSMTIPEFLDQAASNGIILSSSWLPSKGGNFVRDLVKPGSMVADGKVGRNTKYKLTHAGKLEAQRKIAELRNDA